MIGKTIGQYRVIEQLGEGGMATVYLADDLKHERKVAIKVLRPELASSVTAERFLQEIKITAGLTHPHILPLLDSGEADGLLYYVMPYVEGESLHERLKREGPLPVDEALRIAHEIADALHHAHGQDLLHRDIKPENILLEAGHAVVADFGIAKAVSAASDTRMTTAGVSIGTPVYMSPEQASGEHEIDGRSDIYSLGCVLYEMLGGEPPHTGPSTWAIIAKKLAEPAPNVAVLREMVPEAVAGAVARALATDPVDRFANAEEFSAALALEAAVLTGWARSARGGRWRLTAAVMAGLVIGVMVLSLLGREEVTASSWIKDLAALGSDSPTIAVLPLANLSAREENAYLAAGIHEELLRCLSLVRTLSVISRTSVLQYAGTDKVIREIAAELGARYIVEGSVQADQGQVRVQVQLIDATEDRHRWAQRYDRSLENIFEMQSEVAQAIADELQAVVGPEERERIQARVTQDPIAYDLYLRSSRLYDTITEQHETAVQLLRRATDLDSGFALAHTELGWRFFNGHIMRGYPPIDSAFARAERAVALDPDLPDAHALKGWLLTRVGQHEAARASLRQALTLNPNLVLAWTGLADSGWKSGDPVGGALAGRRALEIQPIITTSMWHLGTCLMYVEMYDEAARWEERIVDRYPTHAFSMQILGIASFMAGDLQTARATASRLREMGANVPQVLMLVAWFEMMTKNLEAAEAALSQLVAVDPEWSCFGLLPTARVFLGWVQAESGRPEGRERLENIRRVRVDQAEAGQLSAAKPAIQRALDLMVIASVLGDEEEQIRWFLEAIRLDNNGTVYFTRSFPWFDRIRHRPEFQSWLHASERRVAAQQRELEAMGPWTPEVLLPNAMAVKGVEEVEAVDYDPEDFDALAGHYRMEDSGTIVHFWREGTTLYEQSTGPRYRIVPTSDSTFVLIGFEASVVFPRDPDGRVTRLTIHNQTGAHHGTRLEY